MSTTIRFRSPFANHLAIAIAAFTPGAPASEAKPTAVLDHGDTFQGVVYSGQSYLVTEVERPTAKPARELSHAERLAGVSFNPGGHVAVNEAKAGYAERFAEIEGLLRGGAPIDFDQANMLVAARDHLMAAQMLVVKAITWQK